MKPNHELDFLPAALEIQERPPSPSGRLIVWTISLFFVIALTWSIFGKVDIVATAQGKVVPSGHVKVIQPLGKGIIRAIHVVDGQRVKKGDVLIELDPTESRADVERLQSDLRDTQRNRARLAVLANALKMQSLPLSVGLAVSSKGDADDVALQDQLLRAQWREYITKVAALDADIEKHDAELAGVNAQTQKLRETLVLVTKRADALKRLMDRKLAAETKWMELEQRRIEQRQDLASNRARIKELTAAIVEARQQRSSARAGFAGKVYGDLADTTRKVAEIRQELVKALERTGRQTLKAPVSGIVQQLDVHTVGGVVTPAQTLMKVVPQGGGVEIEAWVLNKDIGYVNKGQQAEVKVETFPFTRYGTVEGQVADVSNDAVTDEKKGLIYSARVVMREPVLSVGGKRIALSPGMAVTVEIKTGARRLIEYILAPLLRYRDEAMRER